MDKKCVKKSKEKIANQFVPEPPQRANVAVVVKDHSIFKLGECFDSYEDLLKRLDYHSKKSMVHYWRRDSRTVRGAYMKTTRPLEPRLVYYYVKYACVFGGQKFLPKGKGHRQSVTMRTNCPAHIMVRANKSGRQLQVISVCNTHNHPITEELYKSLPQDRKLEPSVKQEVLKLLKLGMENKCVLEYVQQSTGKNLTSKDLFNIGAGEKKSKPTTRTRRKVTTYELKTKEEIVDDAMAENESGEEGATAVENLTRIEMSSQQLESMSNQVEIFYKEDLENDKNIIEYMYPSNEVNTLHMIDGEDITADTDIIIENVGIITSDGHGEKLTLEKALQDETFRQIESDAVVDRVSNSMTMNKLKLINIDGLGSSKVKLVNIDSVDLNNIESFSTQLSDSNENTLFNSVGDVPIDQIDLNNIVVIRDNMQTDLQFVQMFKLNDNELLGIDRSQNEEQLEDYITFQTDEGVADYSEETDKDTVVDSFSMLVEDDDDVVHIPSNLNLQQEQTTCESCGGTGLTVKNEIEELKREKEKIEKEVRTLEMKRDMLRSEVRRESSKDLNLILESAYDGPLQYILIDQ